MAAESLEGMIVLLVEDEIMIALEIADALEAAGAQVSGPHTTLEAARQAAQSINADVALLDIDLRGEEVFPAAETLRARGIPFVFYTGRPDREALRTSFANIPVCVKPANTLHLLNELGKLLRVAA